MSYDFAKVLDDKFMGRDRPELPMYDFQSDNEGKTVNLPVLMDAILLANDGDANITARITDTNTIVGGKSAVDITITLLPDETLYTKLPPFSEVVFTASDDYRYAFFCGRLL